VLPLTNARKAASSPSLSPVPDFRSFKSSSPYRAPVDPFLTPRWLDPLFSTTSNFLFPQLLSFHIHTNCPPGVGVPKANIKRNHAKIRPDVPTYQRSNVLTSLESHPCAIVPPKSNGITSLHKNIGGVGRPALFQGSTYDLPLTTNHCLLPSNLSVATHSPLAGESRSRASE
jgi:hypothetical protein